MKSFNINKGVGRSVEFKGLKAQYLFIFAGGLLGALIFVMILYMMGVNSYICLFFGSAGSSLIIWQTFALNGKYGEHGLMKVASKKRHPRFIVNRKPIRRYLKSKLNSKSIQL
ncbi:DUF4133 domain-containing protein [Sphingobacterium sp. DR205]|uniref:DUF4133 domain-containing protein n=1 Tax=Sphingobacterium sp. DR205 TaxID=2713573 RepID=UPI0013E51C67|nr:DUF4133 domain-containing protein [Sphingobacterium sp. DR205]QIH34504.1 DUF4133 domain-containing protein [Sphingobacterium sp. DR205]